MGGLSAADTRRGYKELFRQEKYIPHSNELAEDSPRSFFCKESSGNSRAFSNELQDHIAATKGKGFVSIVTGNHDTPRISRGRTVEELKIAYTAIFTLPGVPVLYYGDEIGMRYLPETGNVEGSYSRGGSRTPMQWTPGQKAGFSNAPLETFLTRPDTAPQAPNVEDQENDPSSLLNYTRSLLKLRHEHPALSAEGEYRPVITETADAPWIYERIGNERFLIAINPAEKRREITLPGRMALAGFIRQGDVSVENSGEGTTTLQLGPISACVWRITP